VAAVTTTARAARAQATHHPDVGRRSGAGPEAVASAGETATSRSAQHLLVRPGAGAVTAVIAKLVRDPRSPAGTPWLAPRRTSWPGRMPSGRPNAQRLS